MSPVTTLLKTLPRARNEVTSTAPVVSVSSTTSESLVDTCERIMADPNLLAGRSARNETALSYPAGRTKPC